jgi:hypothetical protein
MEIQIQTNYGDKFYYNSIKEVFKLSNIKEINKISFINPITNKNMRLLYNNEKNVWIQTPLFYNFKKLEKSTKEINNEYDPYQEYNKEELIILFS